MASPAFKTGRAKMMMNALTKLIQVKSGRRRIVIPGPRSEITVAMVLMAKLIEPIPRTKIATAQ
ncbi:MAG: hypothetical protein Udaeo2_19030 [Candidatus Udaeobacter sp.]|nr:MAG: hypothetical protein Udaeo2_19030 [Candidatus Udaeobacter sp.]